MTIKPRRLLGLSGKMPGKSKTTRVTRGTCSYRAHHSWHHNQVFRGPDGMSLLLDFAFQLFAKAPGSSIATPVIVRKRTKRRNLTLALTERPEMNAIPGEARAWIASSLPPSLDGPRRTSRSLQ
jgi:hypothetical protein